MASVRDHLREMHLKHGEHHIAKAHHHKSMAKHYGALASLHKSSKSEMHGDLEETYSKMADAHTGMADEHTDMAAYCAESANSLLQPASKAAGMLADRDDLSDPLRPDNISVIAIPRNGAPTIRKSEVPEEFKHLVAIEE